MCDQPGQLPPLQISSHLKYPVSLSPSLNCISAYESSSCHTVVWFPGPNCRHNRGVLCGVNRTPKQKDAGFPGHLVMIETNAKQKANPATSYKLKIGLNDTPSRLLSLNWVPGQRMRGGLHHGHQTEILVSEFENNLLNICQDEKAKNQITITPKWRLLSTSPHRPKKSILLFLVFSVVVCCVHPEQSSSISTSMAPELICPDCLLSSTSK